MPFEGQMQAFDIASFSPGVEGLRKLSWLLRHPESWPAEDFEWDFTEILTERIIEKKVRVGFLRSVIDYQYCGSKGCALGLAMTMWPAHCTLVPSGDVVIQIIDAGQRWFGMPHDDAQRIFWDGYEGDDVTPADVADAIDAYLARRAQKIETYG